MTEENTETVENPEALLKAHRELQEDVKALRAENKGLKQQVEALDEDAVSKWKDRALKTEVKSRLDETGVKDSERILKYMKLDGVDFDEEGTLTGFDEKLDEVKQDFPELFDKKRRSGGKADIHTDGSVETQKSLTEKQVDSMFA